MPLSLVKKFLYKNSHMIIFDKSEKENRIEKKFFEKLQILKLLE